MTSNDTNSHNCKLTDVVKAAEGGVTIPRLLTDTGLFPIGPHTEDYKNQQFWANGNPSGTYYPLRGARWGLGTSAGSFAAGVDAGRTGSTDRFGFYLSTSNFVGNI